MVGFLKKVFGLAVVIAVVSYIGIASAGMNLLSSKCEKIESVGSSKNLPDKNENPPELIDANRTLSKNITTYPWAMSNFGLRPINKHSKPKTKLSLYDQYQQLIADSRPGLGIVRGLLPKKHRESNEFCNNKNYAHSAMHVFTKGFSEGFHKKLNDISFNLKLGYIEGTPEIECFADYFNDLISDNIRLSFIYNNDSFYRLFEWAVYQRRQEYAKSKNIHPTFLCTNNLTQDPYRFIIGILTIFGMETLPLIASQLEVKSFHVKEHELNNDCSCNARINIEELATVQTITLNRYFLKIEGFFESLCGCRFQESIRQEVLLHVDTERFINLIVKFKI